jgi:multisubunit Na+/H+ antiporter MnhB subunit
MAPDVSRAPDGAAARAGQRRWWLSKWLQVGVAFVLGLAVLIAFWIGGDPAGGFIGFAIMAAFGLLLLVGGRSDTVRGMRGDGRDERWAMIDTRATALAGVVLIAAIIVGFLVEVALGHDGNPYGWLGALAGVTYLIGLAIGRFRS